LKYRPAYKKAACAGGFFVASARHPAGLFVLEKAHPDIKELVLVLAVHHLTNGVEDLGTAVSADIHGNTQDITHVTGLV